MNSTNVSTRSFYEDSLKQADSEIFTLIEQELQRQQSEIALIASENTVSRAVLEAQGSVLTNKYAEGYPNKRYYSGCKIVDQIEALAIERAKQLFNAKFVNVQPHAGCQANQAVFLALLKPGDTILGMSLDAGGHLTHGAKVSMSGKWFNAVSYRVSEHEHLIDYDDVEKLAMEHQPRLIIAGCSSYPRFIDFARFKYIAKKVGAYLLVDMAHFAGQVAAGLYPTPLEHADIVTTTTHKTLRGARGGMILTNHEELAKKVDSAIFPGIQGGPLLHSIAAKAVSFKEALQPEYKEYMQRVLDNATALGKVLMKRGYSLITGGTDCHLLMLDLRPQHLTGNVAADSLERAHLICNKNGIPFDPQTPALTSGVRFGSPAGTSRGFDIAEFEHIGHLIANILDGLQSASSNQAAIERSVATEVAALCQKFPIYSTLI